MRLAVSVRPIGSSGEALEAQELVLDTGSSTLAFCDSALAAQLGAGQRTEYMSCNMYNPGGATTGYWGRFYRGAVALANGLTLGHAVFSVMQDEESMPCTQGFKGIFGIAFKQLDVAYAYRELGTLGSKCPDNPVTDFAEPMMQALQSAAGSTSLGIYWSGEAGDDQGAIYLEAAADNNPHVDSGTVAGVARLGEVGWYDIDVLEIALSGMGQVWGGSSLSCNATKPCIMDTGTPVLSVPRRVTESINELLASGAPLGSLSVTLAGVGGGPPVTLQFDLQTLLEKQWIQAGSDTGIILGLPMWNWYYTLFDYRAGTATFFEKPASQQSSTTPSPTLAPQVAPRQDPPAPQPNSGAAASYELPLTAKTWGGGMRLAISVGLSADPQGARELLLDTGSSTLAFCGEEGRLVASLPPSAATEYMSCNMYNPGGATTGYWGRFYKSGLIVAGGDLQLNASAFSIMAAETGMPCIDGFQGIFGVAFRQLDTAFPYTDLGPSLTKCPQDVAGDVVPPLMKEVRSLAGAEQLGIFWSGAVGPSQGRLYLGAAATSNEHTASAIGTAKLGELGFYDITVLEVTVGSGAAARTIQGFSCSPRSSGSACIMDTGTPVLSVPKEVLTAIEELEQDGSPTGALTFSLEAAELGAPPVSLIFDIATLRQKGWIAAGTGTGVILGLPMWASYYTAIDVAAHTVTFSSTSAAATTVSPAPIVEPEPEPFPNWGFFDAAKAAPGGERRLQETDPIVV